MPREGVNFTSQELEAVLSQYDIGTIKQTESLNVGNVHAPKKIISSDRGKFLLKRRARGKDDVYHVAYAHTIQMYLEKKGFPVAGLVPTRDQKNTGIYMDNHVYELFHFVPGSRYDGSTEAVTDSGRKLGLFHLELSAFTHSWRPLHRTFHDSPSVRRHLKIIGSQKGSRHNGQDMRQIAEELMYRYNRSSVSVNESGFDSWPEQIVHGDWHPGNMLFASGKVAAVLDFDSVKTAPAITDLANGVLQFSIVAGRPNPNDWPEYLDREKLTHFLAGYREIITHSDNILGALFDQMIETMIAEAVLPIATTGFFGHLSGLDFLKMIHRKCKRIDENRHLLEAAVSP